MENESEAKSIQVLKNQTISNVTECQVTAWLPIKLFK